MYQMAFTQARVWAMMGEARLYEDPPDQDEAEPDIGSEFQKVGDDFARQGHELVDAWRGKQTGHKCIHCRRFQAKKNFNSWLTGEACRKAASGRQRKAAFEERHKEEAKAARRAREEFLFHGTESEDEEGPKEVCNKLFEIKNPRRKTNKK